MAGIGYRILGKDTSKVLLNVYFNPDSEGAGWNFGVRGKPVLSDLGFDASHEYHKYSIEWEPHEIRWLVDGKLIDIRGGWQPSMIPNQPMQVFAIFGHHNQKNWQVSSWTTNYL